MDIDKAIQVSKALIKGALLGMSAYVKPGGLHRLLPTRSFDEILCNIVSTLDHVADANLLGERVKRGEIAFTHIDYGRMFTSVLKESFRSCGVVHPQYVTPLIVLGFSIGFSGVESILEESAKFKKALEIINAINKWSDIKQFIETLRVIGREDMFDHLQSVGYTQITLLRSGISFNEVFRVLSSRWRGFSVIDSRDTPVFGYLKRLSELYREYKSLEVAIVALYMEFIKPHIPQQFYSKLREVETCRYMTAECTKLMYELDTLLRKNKLNFEWASEIVVLTSALGSFEGLK